MDTRQKIKRLEKLIEQAKSHQGSVLPEAALSAWRTTTASTLSEIFGTDTFQVRQFQELKFRYFRGFFTPGKDYSQSDREGAKRVYERDLQITISTFQGYLENLVSEQEEQEQVVISPAPVPTSLFTLHPAVQQVAASRFIATHYSDAIQKACTALEIAVQVKSGLPAGTAGASVMTTAFSKNSPLIPLAADPNEQYGFMALYQGAVMALRNHFAHSLTELTDPARALEWLGFISALFYKLDEAQPPTTPPTPYTPLAGTTPLDQS